MAKTTTDKRAGRHRGETGLAEAIEGLGVFYLGTACDGAGNAIGGPLLVDARRFTTHAVCVGMTGSGKTGLLVTLIEEAALDGIPTLVIDPKGDLANVLLSFPDLAPADFLPWVDPEAAKRDDVTVDELAARTAAAWSKGLAASGQSGDRIRRLREAAEMAVYTPGSRAGRPLAMLGSLEAPAAAVLADPEARRERIESLVSGILALVGIDAEPGTSRDHVLLSAIVENLWQTGRTVDFGTLVRTIPTPPIDRVGFLDLETFYPAGDRFQLATRLNTVAAAPGFEAWLEGEPLDVGRLLWTPAGKPRVAIVSIAHLAEAQRMAFVTLLAGQTVSWMRSQAGTSSLKAMFLMDEVFGYVPPVSNPPSKAPILTLLKQARAYRLGVVLATQNPVDLDYKGLSNAGLWFLGRLQTARDKARVLDGLEGAAASAGGAFERGRLDRLPSGLEQRRFLMHSVHGEEETLFQTRWTMSYLRGPLLREEIRRLTADDAAAVAEPRPRAEADDTAAFHGGPRPILPPGVCEVFFPPSRPLPADASVHYEPHILGRAIVRYSLTGAGVEEHRETFCLAPAGESLGESAWKAAVVDEVSRPEEDEGAFRSRLAHRVRGGRDAEMERVRSREAAKLATLAERIERARQKVEKEKAEAQNQSLQTYVSIGSAVLGSLFGRKKINASTIGKAATSMRSASRAARQQADVAHAAESLASLEERHRQLEEEIETQLERIRLDSAPERITLEKLEIPARKTGTTVEDVVLAWVPSRGR